jgi:hypothetical protein
VASGSSFCDFSLDAEEEEEEVVVVVEDRVDTSREVGDEAGSRVAGSCASNARTVIGDNG